MKYKCIAFDMDGTLLNSESVIFITLKKTVEKYLHKSMSEEDLKFALGIPGDETIRRLKIEEVFEALAYWDKLYYEMRDAIQPYEGVKEVLSDLKEKGYRIGLVTSGYRKEVEDHMQRLHMMDCFDVMICADDTKKHKPEADPLLKLVKSLQMNKEEVLYVGDSIYDAMCAQKANIDFGLAVWGATNKNVEATYLLKTIQNVYEVIQ